MALFGLIGNYSKPGPGVSKDEPKKAAPLRFFEILWRKLSKLVQLNLIFMIPFTIAVVLMVLILFLPLPHFAFDTALLGALDLYVIYVVPIPMIFLSPFTAGMAYVTRNFAREEHAFVWSDFWDAVKNNWKPSLLNGVIVYAAYVILSFSIFFYSNQMNSNWLFMIPFAICCLLAIMMLFAQYYIPLMIVTFDLKLRHIYRNAFIFAILGLLRNLLITAVIVAMIIGTLYCPGGFLVIPLILLVLIVFSFISYLSSFATYSIVDKYLIQPFYQKEAEASAQKTTATEGETFSFETDELDEDDEDAPKYVYVNGRLIDRNLLKEDSVFSDETKEHLN